MPPRTPPTAASALALQGAAAAGSRMSDIAGEAGSRDTLAQLSRATTELKALAIQPLLQRAINALNAGQWQKGSEWAQKALEKDARNGVAWYLMGIARERLGDFASSITAYESALALLPEQTEVANDLGRLAFRLGMLSQAEKLFRHFLARHPGHTEAINNLTCALRDQERYGEAIETIRPVLMENAGNVQLWNTMGTVMTSQGDYANAQIFFQEALRLDPGFYKARYNLGNARLILGDAAGALEDCDAALAYPMTEDERLMMRMARSTILMGLGRIAEGWDEYEARLHPRFADSTIYLMERPRWEPGADLAGCSLMLFCEQGLGDEILFSNMLPDVIDRLGPDGRLTLAVEPRLVPIFKRSYPQARVGAHAIHTVGGRLVCHAPFLKDDMDSIALWAPIASLLREFRRTVDAFPSRPSFMTADPERVAHWAGVLKDLPGPKVGLLWKSAISRDARHRYFSPFRDWAPVLKTPGVTFVNLQYGDCADELATAEREFGVRIWNPPGIDLKQDLDDVTALSAAMDLVIGFSNATFNLAAAVGTPVWLISTPGVWTRLGTSRYPWYPQARTFTTTALGAWTPIMEAVGDALGEFAQAR